MCSAFSSRVFYRKSSQSNGAVDLAWKHLFHTLFHSIYVDVVFYSCFLLSLEPQLQKFVDDLMQKCAHWYSELTSCRELGRDRIVYCNNVENPPLYEHLAMSMVYIRPTLRRTCRSATPPTDIHSSNFVQRM
jgi:hypothetical protein